MIALDVQNVLLCGTQYGRVYLPAIYEQPGIELAGILARGSVRSVRLAEQAGVPLFHEVNELDEPIDMACVAVGEEIGLGMALKLLQKKIPVLIEHPISVTGCQQLLQAATEAGVPCHINGHFADLPPAVDFVKAATRLNAAYRPLVVTGSANPRTLYSWLDMLMRAFGSGELKNLNLQTPGNAQDYSVCTFQLNEMPVSLTLQNWIGAEDDSKDAPLGHQFSVTYPIGNLQLTGTYGQCIWNPLVAAVADRSIPCSFTGPGPVNAVIAQLTDWRIKANQKAISQLLAEAIRKGTPVRHQSAKYLKALTTAWSAIKKALPQQTRPAIPEAVPGRLWNVFGP